MFFKKLRKLKQRYTSGSNQGDGGMKISDQGVRIFFSGSRKTPLPFLIWYNVHTCKHQNKRLSTLCRLFLLALQLPQDHQLSTQN